MTNYTFSTQTQLTSFLEYARLYTMRADAFWVNFSPKPSLILTPFYYESSTNTVNFGYGINLTAAATDSELKSKVNSVLAALEQPVTITEEQWSAIANGGGEPTESERLVLQNITTSLNAYAEDNNSTLIKDAAAAITEYKLYDLNYSNSAINGVKAKLSNFDLLTQTAQNALIDLQYNTGGSFMPTNGALYSALHQLVPDYASAAYEMAFNTSTSGDHVYESRCLIDAAQMLGLNVTINGNYFITGVSGTSSTNSVNLIHLMQEVADNHPSSYLANNEVKSFVNNLTQYLGKQGYYVPQSEGDIPSPYNLAFLQRLNAVFSDADFGVGGLIHTPAKAAQFPTSTIALALTPLSAGLAYVYDPFDFGVWVVGASLDGHDSGQLIMETQVGGSYPRFDSGTYNSVAYDYPTGTFSVGLQDSYGQKLGMFNFNATTDTGSITLLDNFSIPLTNLSGIHLTATSASGVNALSDYLTQLNHPLLASDINQLDLAALSPSSGGTVTPYTVTGSVVTVNGYTFDNFTIGTTPGAVVNGLSGAINTIRIGNINATAATTYDLTKDTINGVQNIVALGANLIMTGAQFNSFAYGIDSFSSSHGVGGSLTITSSGTYSLADHVGDSINYTARGHVKEFIAAGWEGTTLIGNSENSQILRASQFGNDTLIAGNPANGVSGDTLIAGQGINTLIGSTTGNTVFVASNGLADGSSITGTGTNLLVASGDISGATITGVGTLGVGAGNIFGLGGFSAGFQSVTLTSDQLSQFSSIQTNAGYIYAANSGTYSLEGINTDDGYTLIATSSEGTTLIANDASNVTLIASKFGNDTLKAGNGDNVTLIASAYGNDTLYAGTGNNILYGGYANNTFYVGDALVADSNVSFQGGRELQVYYDPATLVIQKGATATVIAADAVLKADNGSDGLIQNIINWNAGGSRIVTYTEFGSSTTKNYTDADGSGTLTDSSANINGTLAGDVVSLTDGGEQIVFSRGDTVVVDAGTQMTITGNDGTMIASNGADGVFQNTINWNNGTSEKQLFTGLPDGVTQENFTYSGADLSGDLTKTVTDYSNGSSTIELFNPNSSITFKTSNFLGLNGTGTLTYELTNYTDGTSLQREFIGLEAGVVEVDRHYSGADATGDLTTMTTYYASGNYEVDTFNPSAGVASEGLVYSVHTENGQTKALFAGVDANGNNQLWMTDGTGTGTVQLTSGSGINPNDITVLGYHALFAGKDVNGVNQLWTTDGSLEGTKQLTATAFGTNPFDITVFGNKALFSGTDNSGNGQVWITDGSISGTSQLTSIPNTNPYGITVIGSKAIFNANNQIWITDGTVAGTTQFLNASNLSSFSDIAVLGNEAIFAGYDDSGNGQLWKTDGTAAGTIQLSSGSNVSPSYVVAFGTKVLFSGYDDNGNGQIWLSDGTTAGTMQLTAGFDISPYSITVVGNKAVFSGYDANGSNQLWVTDGTTTGTAQLTTGDGANVNNIVTFGSNALFEGTDAENNYQLWITDGTATGTVQLTSGSALYPSNITVFGDKALFWGMDVDGNGQLWMTDGTAAGTQEIIDITNASGYGISPSDITTFVIANQVSILTKEITTYTAGNSTVVLFNPNSTVLTNTKYYDGANGTGTLLSQTIDLADGSSKQILYSGLASGVTKVTSFYTEADLSGILTKQVTDYANGTSSIGLFNLSGTISAKTKYYSGLDGTGVLVSQVIDLVDGTSKQIVYTGLPAGISQITSFYTGADLTGDLTKQITNFAAGTSTIKLFNVSDTVSTNTKYYSGLDGTGTLLSQTLNLVAGGSKQLVFSGLPSGESEEILFYSGADLTGSLTKKITDYTAGNSIVVLYNVSATVSQRTDYYSGLDASGTLLSQTFNLVAGGSKQTLFTGLPSGVTETISFYSGADLTGTLTKLITDFTAGNSTVKLYNPSSTVLTNTKYYTGLDGTGTLTSETINLTAGGSKQVLYLAGGIQETLVYSGADLTGTLTSNTFAGTSGNDTLATTAGAETLVGNGGYDTYQFGRGNGFDIIKNGLSTNTTATGELDLGADIATNQIWFEKKGNNLQVDILGTQDHMTISGWYSNTYSQLQEIKTADGSMIDSQLANLVQAMASYSSSHSGFNPTTATQMPTDTALQNALAAAWHQ